MAIIDTHLATKKIKIRRIDSKDIFLSTIWKGEIVMGFFDTTTCKISQLTCFRCIDSEEVKQLESVITNYIFSGSRKNLV